MNGRCSMRQELRCDYFYLKLMSNELKAFADHAKTDNAHGEQAGTSEMLAPKSK